MSRSQSAQFAAIGLPPKQRKKKATQTVTLSVAGQPAVKKAKMNTGAQIPRGFVTALAADSKYIETITDVTKACDTTGTVTHLDIVALGDGVTARTGKSWINTNIQIRGSFVQGTAAITNVVAVYLVWDRQPNKALATVGDILETSGGVSATAFMKRENKGRFVTIKKWYRVLAGNITAPATGREILAVDKWIRMPQEAIAQATAADNSGVIANRVTGALLLLTIGNTAAGTGAASFVFRYRLGFKDPQ